MFLSKEINGKIVYYSDIIPVEHFFTSRDLIVKESAEEISNYLKIKKENIITPNQTHSDNIKVVKNGENYTNTDCLIVDDSEYAICLNFADCTPVVFYDLKNNIGAIAHCGWRGTAQQLAKKTYFKMKELYNSNSVDIYCAIGPCISFKEFETYDKALVELKQSIEDASGLFEDNYADLKGINKKQLEEVGIKNIDVCPYCTVLDNDKFFSYRKENKTTKRHSAVLKINK